jgi:hypothetical protein
MAYENADNNATAPGAYRPSSDSMSSRCAFPVSPCSPCIQPKGALEEVHGFHAGEAIELNALRLPAERRWRVRASGPARNLR